MSRLPLDTIIVDSVLKYYNIGLTCNQIGKIFGISGSSVTNIFHNAGLPKQYTAKQLKILKYRQEGLCCVEIAALMKMDNKNVRKISAQLGMPFTKEEIERSIQLGAEKSVRNQYGSKEERIQNNIKAIAEKHPGFEYVSGWISSDKPMKLRCKCCGNEIIKSAITVRSSENLQCPFCEEIHKKQKQEELRLLKEKTQKEAIKEKEQRFWNQPFEQEAVSFCPVCNSAFYGRPKYCSDDCMRRACNSKGKDKRLRRLRDRQIDDITLQALYERDNGKCWICGGDCDFDDYFRDQNNNFIVGGNYPSIDHVYPLSKGGLHSWDNVKLAHHYCNTVKSNKVVCL